MKKSEVAQLLDALHAIHGGDMTDLEVETWFSVIGDVDYTHAERQFHLHYAKETRRVMPADIRKGFMRRPTPPPPGTRWAVDVINDPDYQANWNQPGHAIVPIEMREADERQL